MTDEMAWVLQAQKGDDEAFTNLVEMYQKPVYNLCYRMLGDAEGAEDAAQETFLKAYQNLARYDVERSFATWLLSIAAHHCIDKLRRKRFSSFSIDEDEESQTVPPRTLRRKPSASRPGNACKVVYNPLTLPIAPPLSCVTGRIAQRSRSPRRSN